MTTQDYATIARIVREQAELGGGTREDALRAVVSGLCDMLKKDYPSYGVTRFRNACGVRT